jgi:hypothetical protein
MKPWGGPVDQWLQISITLMRSRSVPYPDPHQNKKSDPDPHKQDADPPINMVPGTQFLGSTEYGAVPCTVQIIKNLLMFKRKIYG